MANASGEVVIISKLDNSEYEAGSKELVNSARRMASKLNDATLTTQASMEKMTASLAKQNAAYAAQKSKVESLRAEINRLSGTRVETAAYRAASREVESLEKKINALVDKEERFLATGGDVNSTAFERMDYDIEQLGEKMRAAQARKEALLNSGGAYTSPDLSSLNSQLESAEQKLSLMGNSLQASWSQLEAKADKYGNSTAKAATNTNKLSAALKKLHPKIKGSNKSLQGGLKTLLRYGLGIRSLFVLFNRLRSALTESFQALAQGDATTNKSLSMLTSALKTLKYSLATAFAPILNAVAPAVTSFIKLITNATNTVGKFFAALTGQKTFVQAVEVQEDYAASLNKTAKAAKKAATNLSGLDEINKWQSADNSGDSDVSAPQYKTVGIESSISDFAKKLKDAWKKADFTDIGATIGKKLSDGLETINWGDIKNKSRRIATSIATFINGFVETPNLWENVGSTIAQGLNTALAFVDTFVNALHWSSIGGAFTTTILSFFTDVDFKTIGSTISGVIKGVLDMVSGALLALDWNAVFSGIIQSAKDFFEGFDWTGAFESIGKLIGSLLTTAINLTDAIHNIFASALIGLKDFFLEKISTELDGLDEDATILDIGLAIIKGILKGLWDGIKGIGLWLWNNIIKPVIDGFKEGFGIHSPSTVMAGIGRNLIEGLTNGITERIAQIKEKINSIKTWITNKLSSLGEGLNLEAFKQKLTNAFTDAKNAAVAAFSNIKEKITAVLESLKNVLKIPINGVLSVINKMMSGLGNGINKAINALNKINIKVPSWVPSFGGKSFGFDIKPLSIPQIPYLATGAVIPPNAPFTAVLGDQRNGNNLEMPESLLRQIVREESGNQGANTYSITAKANGRALFDLVLEEGKRRQAQTGKNPFAFSY